jgi:hypothetical protein
VLERIHHVFNELENVVVIIAMEKKQMSNSLHQIYGDEMDVDRYLKKNNLGYETRGAGQGLCNFQCTAF